MEQEKPKLNDKNIYTDSNLNNLNIQNKKKKNDQVYFPSLTQENKKKWPNKKQDFQFSFMHSLKFEKMNQLNKQFVNFMKDDKMWQKYRKKMNPVSNPLDGSYKISFYIEQKKKGKKYIIDHGTQMENI